MQIRQLQKLLLVILFIAALPVLIACTHKNQTSLNPQPAATVQQTQYYLITKDGVEIARPDDWYSTSDDSALIYQVSRADTIRITVGVTNALPLSYYDGLVNNRNVTRTSISGYIAYRNDYTYPYNGNQLKTECVTIVQGAKACHLMFLCDVSVLGFFEPVFNEVLHSVKFL